MHGLDFGRRTYHPWPYQMAGRGPSLMKRRKGGVWPVRRCAMTDPMLGGMWLAAKTYISVDDKQPDSVYFTMSNKSKDPARRACFCLPRVHALQKGGPWLRKLHL